MANDKQAKLLTTAEKLRKFKLFNEKLEVFRRGRFFEQLSGPDHSVTMNFGVGQPTTVEMRSADEEAVLALVTTLRFFVQPRDGIMPTQIADIYDTLQVESRAKESARQAAEAIETYLDTPTANSVNYETLTHRRIFEVFMYGGIAHANEDKREEYEIWMSGPMSGILNWFFRDIAAYIVSVLTSFYQMNQRTIEFLESEGRSSLKP
jgi:hypothetical protein